MSNKEGSAFAGDYDSTTKGEDNSRKSLEVVVRWNHLRIVGDNVLLIETEPVDPDVLPGIKNLLLEVDREKFLDWMKKERREYRLPLRERIARVFEGIAHKVRNRDDPGDSK